MPQQELDSIKKKVKGLEAEFRCANCGNKVERNLMPWKHAVLGAIPSLNRRVSCCEEPDYEDTEGFEKAHSRKSLRQSIPNFA